jgi:hypothetical protein
MLYLAALAFCLITVTTTVALISLCFRSPSPTTTTTTTLQQTKNNNNIKSPKTIDSSIQQQQQQQQQKEEECDLYAYHFADERNERADEAMTWHNRTALFVAAQAVVRRLSFALFSVVVIGDY